MVNGHQDGAPKTSGRCSRGRVFMAEEPVERLSRSPKAKPSSLSLFEWVLTIYATVAPMLIHICRPLYVGSGV